MFLEVVDWLNEICHREADGNINFQHMQAILKIYLLVAEEEQEKLISGNPPEKAEEDHQETDSKKKAP